MIEKVKSYLVKYKGLIMYAVFGFLTTLINTAVYYISYNLSGIPNILSTIIAWLLAVAFAFVTNKLWVFESRSFDKEILLREISTFVGCRLATGLLDVGIMFVAVDVLKRNSTIWKLISNIIVIIINYIASKMVIFRKAHKG